MAVKRSSGADPESVRALIRETLDANQLLGSGNHAHAYAFADKAFDPYVLRIHAMRAGETPDKALTHRTKLTPPHRMVRGGEFGQALLVNNPRHANPFLGIHMRVPGMSLRAWREALPDMAGRAEYMLDAMERTGINPFTTLFSDVYRVARSGHMPDTNLGNILYHYHDGAMRLIDQFGFAAASASHDEAMERVRNLQRTLSAGLAPALPEGTAPALIQAYAPMRALLLSLMEDAAMAAAKETRPLAFGAVHEVQAARMETPRAALLETLQQLAGQVRER